MTRQARSVLTQVHLKNHRIKLALLNFQ